jgi:hypothetical protein
MFTDLKQTFYSYGDIKECLILVQAILQMNSSHMRSEIPATACINVTVEWGFYRNDRGSRFFRNVVIYVSLRVVKSESRVVWMLQFLLSRLIFI